MNTTPSCLVLMPYGRSHQHWQERIRQTIVDVLERTGVSAVLPDEFVAGARWADAMLESLRSSDFIIADLSESNPNVIFELGVAHGLRKPFIILVSTKGEGTIPSDLLGYQYITYDPTDPFELEFRLEKIVRAMQMRLEASR